MSSGGSDRRTEHVGAAVDGAGHQRHLQQGGQLLLVLQRGAWVHHAALVVEDAVGADQGVARDRLPEHLHTCGDGDGQGQAERGRERDSRGETEASAYRPQLLVEAQSTRCVRPRMPSEAMACITAGAQRELSASATTAATATHPACLR